MCFKYFDQALVLSGIFIKRFEFVTTGTKGAARRTAQTSDRTFRFFGRINKIFIERTNNAVGTDEHLTDHIFVFGRGL